VEDARQYENELREVRALVERIKRGDCVLVLGPRVAIRPDDPERMPLDEILARELLESIGEPADISPNLRRAADLYYRQRKDRDELELAVADFYRRNTGATTAFHRDLAALPFLLCVSASPDNLMCAAFEAAGKSPQKGYYNFRAAAPSRLSAPRVETPLVYHLFGHADDPTSLVLTEGDLIEFLVAVVKGTPPVPDHVRSMLAVPAASFLFLGFGFQNWYLRVLLQVMNIYGHRSKAVAFEDKQFFDSPERAQTVGFFSGDRLIDFRPLRWEAFAKQLREVWEASAPKAGAPARAIEQAGDGRPPKVFLSYASEDRSAVSELGERLETRGIRVWQDERDLRAGDNWNNIVVNVIQRQADYVVFVQTPAMMSQSQGVFNRELELASQRQSEQGEYQGMKFRFLIPVRIGDCPRRADVNELHVIDVSTPAGVDALAVSIAEDWRRRTQLATGAAAGA
jgi:hypothetical protein